MDERLHHYRTEEDYWRVRKFFRDLPRPSLPWISNWDLALFDYWRWHWLENVVERHPRELCFWTGADQEIVAVLTQGDPGVCHLHVHPDHRSTGLLENVVATAERECSTPRTQGGQAVFVWLPETDQQLVRILRKRGYETSGGDHAIEHHGRRDLGAAIPDVPVAEGYSIRSMGDVDEHPRRSLASWRAFHPDEPDSGCDMSGAWYRNVQRAPLYRRDLDVVAVAPNGDIASFALAFFDDVARAGVFVLDGTALSHRRLGLAKAVMTEALQRLQWLGATSARVSWYESAAGALYESVGLREEATSRCWMKRL